jgi:hypothetical protein
VQEDRTHHGRSQAFTAPATSHPPIESIRRTQTEPPHPGQLRKNHDQGREIKGTNGNCVSETDKIAFESLKTVWIAIKTIHYWIKRFIYPAVSPQCLNLGLKSEAVDNLTAGH